MSDELDRILSIEESALNKNKEIDRILSCSELDYFSILEINPISPSYNSNDLPTLVKKLYRKKSLLIHPDKIDNPKAPEAFDKLKKSEFKLNSDLESDINEIKHLQSIYDAYKPKDTTEIIEFNDDINIKIRNKVKEVLLDEINQENLSKIYKQHETIRKDELRKTRQVEEQLKRELKKNWEDERDVRVDNWRKYSNKVEKKQLKKKSTKKKKVLV